MTTLTTSVLKLRFPRQFRRRQTIGQCFRICTRCCPRKSGLAVMVDEKIYLTNGDKTTTGHKRILRSQSKPRNRDPNSNNPHSARQDKITKLKSRFRELFARVTTIDSRATVCYGYDAIVKKT